MGRYSIPSRPSRDHWFRVGTVDVTTTVLITALACLSMFVYAANPAWLAPLVLDSTRVTAGQIWRLVAWPIPNPPDLMMSVIPIALYFYFGRDLERMLGRTKYLWMTLMLIAFPALGDMIFAVATGQPFAVFGMAFLEAAVIVAFVVANPTARSFFDIPLWVIGAVFLGVNALQYLGVRNWGQLVFLALVVATAMVGARSFGISRLTWIPKLPLPAFVTGDHSRVEERKRQRKQHLHVVEAADIDSILDKIAAQGIGSLTADERRRLDRHSASKDS